MPQSSPPSNVLVPHLQAMITAEHLTVAEAVQWCAGAINHREAVRLRQLTEQAYDSKPEDHSTTVASIP
jgi:hypothetical protein